MAETVTVAIDSGALLVEDGVLHVGELAPIAFAGYAPGEGNSIRLTLFDRDGKTPLADNHSDAAVLDLRGERLRKAFRETHAIKLFFAVATEVTSGGESTGEVLATGQVPVAWSPLVFDAATGKPASLRGPKGDTGDTGASAFEIWKAQDPSRAGLDEAAFIAALRGAPTAMHFVWDAKAECYRRITLIEEPETGELVIKVDEKNEYSADGVLGDYVVLGGDQTITGKKTFAGGAEVPSTATLTVGKTPTADGHAANKKYVDDAAEAARAAAVEDNSLVKMSGNQTIAGTKTFSDLPVVPLTPSENGHAASKKYVDDAAHAAVQDSSLVKTSGNQTIAGTKTFSDLPVVPVTPSENGHAASKRYVDIAAASAKEEAIDAAKLYADTLPGLLMAVTEIALASNNTPVSAQVTVPANTRFRCVGVYYATNATSTTVTLGSATNTTAAIGLATVTDYLATGESSFSLTITAQTTNVSYVKKLVVFVFQALPPAGE